MAESERLITLKNVTDQPVSITWDGVDYTWQAGEEKTLVYGIGLHARDNRQSQLEVVGDSVGFAPQAVKTEVQLVNNGKEDLSLGWDGVPYVFKPGEPVTVDESIAHALMTNARQLIARDELDATLEPIAYAGTAIALPESEAPAPKPKKVRKPKKEEPKPTE